MNNEIENELNLEANNSLDKLPSSNDIGVTGPIDPSPLDKLPSSNDIGVTGPIEPLPLDVPIEPKSTDRLNLVEPVPEPVVESVPEPVVEPLPEPVVEPVSEPVVEPVAEPIPEPVAEPVAEPVENNNVNVEQEMAYYESNKEMILNKMADLQNELDEEENLKVVLDDKESLSESDVEKMEKFIKNNKDEIQMIYDNALRINTRLRDLVKHNKDKQEKMKARNEKYNELVNSNESLELARNVKYLKSTLNNLDDFLVKEGVKGPKSQN